MNPFTEAPRTPCVAVIQLNPLPLSTTHFGLRKFVTKMRQIIVYNAYPSITKTVNNIFCP